MRIATALLAAALVVGCSDRQPSAPAPTSGIGPGPVEGRVLEKLGAGSYIYLRLSTAEGELWAAVPNSSVTVGAEVTIANPHLMEGFTSPTLERTFERIVFGTLAQTPGAEALPPGHPRVDTAAAPAGHPQKAAVAKAEGGAGKTVAEVHSQRADLSGQPVTVRGEVVKFNAGILGANWVHLRDGSGSAQAGDHDLLVTTQDTVAVGDVVVIEGRVSVDRDFGAGYQYAVMIENGTVLR